MGRRARLGEPAAASAPPAGRICILFVGANNSDEVKLSLEREIDAMRKAFTEEWGTDAWRNSVVFEAFFFTDAERLVQAIQRFKPVGVHFVCHGFTSALSLHRDLASVDRLAEALAAWAREPAGSGLRFLVANSCDSAHLASVLAAHVDLVVGHHKPVRDKDALKFACVFYGSLGRGLSFKSSFDLAKAASGSTYCLRGRKDATKFAFSRPVQTPSQIHVKTASGQAITLEIEPGDSVDTIKHRIRDVEVCMSVLLHLGVVPASMIDRETVAVQLPCSRRHKPSRATFT